MAYQCKQPCLPPPSCMAQCSSEAMDTSAPTGNAACTQPSIPCQTKQPCLPPPICVQPCSAEAAPTCSSTCNTAPRAEECPSDPCEAPAHQPCFPAPVEVHACTSEEPRAPGGVTLCDTDCVESEPVVSYVVPGSVVCLNPRGDVTVKPGPAVEADTSNSVFLESYRPHFL